MSGLCSGSRSTPVARRTVPCHPIAGSLDTTRSNPIFNWVTPVALVMVERVLLAQPGVGTYHQLAVAPGGVTVHSEGTASAGAVAAALRAGLGLDLRVLVERPGTLPRRPGKAQRVRWER
jgi:hypothetical protein